MTLKQMQNRICDREGFKSLNDYETLTRKFLSFIHKAKPTRIISPTSHNYIFYQYDKRNDHRITRPLNTDLFIEDEQRFRDALQHVHDILDVVRKVTSGRAEALRKRRLDSLELDRIVYTVQQSIGSVGDSLSNPNQARKRIGMLFESLVKLLINEVGVSCESRTIKVPLPGHPGRFMSYELDLVLSRGKAIVTSETELVTQREIIGSVKTTSKDRIDKVFLDKFLLSKLLGRDVRVIALFLHDVQRARKRGSIFGVNSTFKSNHFLGYTIALNPLDGVYYVDPPSVRAQDDALARRISQFSRFITQDLWKL